MIKYYKITKDDRQKIKDLAEKIYLNKEKLDDKIITWEDFTTKWTWFDLPDSQIDQKNWIENRSTWVRLINDEFIKRKNACRLYVVFGRGVQLSLNERMVSKHIIKNTKKTTNCLSTVVSRTENMLESNTEGKRLLRIFSSATKRTMIYLYGEVQLSSLPKDVKTNVLKLLKSNIPEEQQNLFNV